MPLTPFSHLPNVSKPTIAEVHVTPQWKPFIKIKGCDRAAVLSEQGSELDSGASQ